MSEGAKDHYERGLVLVKQSGMEEEALAEFLAAAQAEPGNATYHAWLANAYYLVGDYRHALADYAQALSLDPSLTGAYVGRGDVFMRQGDWFEALRDYTSAIERCPNDPNVYMKRAAARVHYGEYRLALTDCDTAYRLDPSDSEVRSSARQIAIRSGETRGVVLWNARCFADLEIAAYDFWSRQDNSTSSTCRAHLVEAVAQTNYLVVDWFPARLYWGFSSVQGTVGRRTANVLSAQYGCGYAALTDKGLVVQSLGALSRSMPGRANSLVSASGLSTSVTLIQTTEDAAWLLTYDHITGTHTHSSKVLLSAGADGFEIHPLDKGHSDRLSVGIDLGKHGEFEGLVDPPPVAKPAPQLAAQTAPAGQPAAPGVDPIAEIERLGTLLDKGLITQAQFEAKRDDLLKRV